MPISEIPSKIIEKAGSLFEKKLEVAGKLTEIICKQTHDQKTVLKTFHDCLNDIKDAYPQDQFKDTLLRPTSKRHWFWLTTLIFAIGVIIIAGLIFWSRKAS